MKHSPSTIKMLGREVSLFTEPDAESLLVQCVDSHDMEEMDKELTTLEQSAQRPFALAAERIQRWNDEIAPWPAPPVWGKTPFGDGAAGTLEFIQGSLLPKLKTIIDYKQVFLGGYSLAGLFALWAGCQTNVFKGIAAVSPSVWYKGWIDYSRSNRCLTEKVYLSLGDRESHSKNKLMATVADAIREQKLILNNQGISNVLEWNPGNHFTDNGLRMAKGFAWLVGSSPNISKGEDV